MKRVLVCTIMRNQRSNVDRWLEQLNELTQLLMGQVDLSFSIVENDSVDGTDEWLRQRISPGDGVWLTTEKLGTQQYGSVWNVDRLRQLANARQCCLDQVGDLSRFSKIAYIEPDVEYDARWIQELILARHPIAAGLGEPDIYSGWSLRSLSNPKESVYLYDTCATRATMYDTHWDISEANGTWRGKTVIPTDLGGPDAMCLHSVWSTFNGFCVYNAQPFKDGARWGFVNPRLDTGQGWVDDGINGKGTLDADTSVMCERFRARGFNKVYLNTNCLVRHS